MEFSNLNSTNPSTLEWALVYHERGYIPVPIPPQKKYPHLKDWTKIRYRDANEVIARFTGYETANIGLLARDLVVFDIDKGAGGLQSFRVLLNEIGEDLPDTPHQKTGGGGDHYIFAKPAGLEEKNTTGIRPGIDIRTDGGQIVVPGSIHPNGNRYQWVAGKSPLEINPAPLPDSLRALLSGPAAQNSNERVLDGSVGTRNTTLFKLACFLRGQGADESEIQAELFARNSTFDEPLDGNEVLQIVQSSLKYDAGTPRYHANDNGNASRFVAEFGESFRFAADSFYAYDGKLWERIENEVAEQSGRELSEKMLAEANELPEDSADQKKMKKAVVSHARRTGDSARIKALLRLASGDPNIRRNINDFDNVPGKLPVANGIVDLRTGELEAYSRDALITKASRIEYNPKAEAPKFQKILDFCLANEHREFLQKSLGYAICGEPVEQKFFVWKGDGANGKSVIANVVGDLLGTMSARTEADTFLDLDRNSSGPRPDLMALQGKRLVVASEVPSRRRLDAVTIKRIAGGEPISGRGLYQNTIVEFDVTFSILLLTNPFPRADETDSALWRRLVLLPFDRVVPEDKRNPRLSREILAKEAEGVLAWLVEGARKYYADGLSIPQSIRNRIAEWRRQVGSIERYFSEGPSVRSSGLDLRQLHAGYANWCRSNSLHPYGIEAFKSRIVELGARVDQVGAREIVSNFTFAA